MRDLDQLVREAQRAGWDVTATKKGHVKLSKGDKVIIAPKTSCSRRGFLNFRARLRREEASDGTV